MWLRLLPQAATHGSPWFWCVVVACCVTGLLFSLQRHLAAFLVLLNFDYVLYYWLCWRGVCLPVCMHDTHTQVCVFVCVCICKQVRMCFHVCMCVVLFMCVCIRVRLYVCIYMYYVCIHVCVYVYIYVCPCVHVWARLYALVINWLCRCTPTHCFCAYFRVIPFCTSSRGGQIHSLGYRLRHVRAIYLPCAFSLRLVGAKFGPSLFLCFSSLFTSLRILVALIILAATSPGGFVFLFSVVRVLPALFHCCPPNAVTIGRHTPVI